MGLKRRRNRSPQPPERCALTQCLAVISGAWAPNVIWHLRAGARRFSELRSDIPPVSAKVLSQRLRELEARGVISRTIQPTSPPSVEYALTALGRELVPALGAIVDVGHRLKQSGIAAGPTAPGTVRMPKSRARGHVRTSADVS
jgi:DNA-binding HxlR family transcriptional regulator